jgi:7-cyano-7-deazaguanine synthase
MHSETGSEAAVVLFSGGQDSTTCLYWALQRFSQVWAFGVDYGQRHAVETEQARKIAQLAGVPYTLVSCAAYSEMASSALTNPEISLNDADAIRPGLPASFVPGRNLSLLTLAAGFAYTKGVQVIVGGMCQTDYSGYPDCRREFIDQAEKALSLALDGPLSVETPLMYLTKAETWRLAADIGCLEVVRNHSHTCYAGDRAHWHDWGYGCGNCPACKLREAGYREAFG